MEGRLVLFDIDGTLLDTGGAGMAALRQATRTLHGSDGPELHLGGATDSGLVMEILDHFEVEVSEERVAEFYRTYLQFLEEHLASGDFGGQVFPGVQELLDALVEDGATLALLTGNVSGGADLKIRHFGLAGYFHTGAYGDDHHDRNELGPIALSRAEEHHGRRFVATETVVIGDTPKDVACGKALGAVTVAVATGSFSAAELGELGADLVVEALSDAGDLIDGLRRVSPSS